MGEINPQPGFVDRGDVFISVSDFIGSGDGRFHEIDAILDRDDHPIPDQKIKIPWDDKDKYRFITDSGIFPGTSVETIADVYPLDKDYARGDQVRFGTILKDEKKGTYFLFVFSETDVRWKYEEEWHELITSDDISSIQTHWSYPAVFDIFKEHPDKYRDWTVRKYGLEDLVVAPGPYFDGDWVMLNISKFPMLVEVTGVYYSIGASPRSWTEFQDPYAFDWGDEEEQAKWEQMWEDQDREGYIKVINPPKILKDYFHFRLKDYLRQGDSMKDEKNHIWVEPQDTAGFMVVGGTFEKGEHIEFLEPPFLRAGDKVLFKSGENGEGLMKKGRVKEMLYCDWYGVPFTDDWMPRFPWKFVKLSEYIGDYVHYGTNVAIIDDSGKEWLIGGRWIFPHPGKGPGDDKPKTKGDVTVPPEIEVPKLSESEDLKETIPPEAETETETEKEKETVPPEMEQTPPPEVEETIPPEEETIPPEIDDIPPEIDDIPPEVPERKKRKKKKKEIEEKTEVRVTV